MLLRPVLLCLLALATAQAWAQAPTDIPWLTNPERILTENVDQPLFIFFFKPDEPQSDRMTNWVFTNWRVAQALRGLRTIRVDADLRPHLTERFRVARVPTCLLVTPQDQEFGRLEGALNPDELVEWLDRTLGRLDSLEPDPTPGRQEPPTADQILEGMFQSGESAQVETTPTAGPPGLPPPPETMTGEAIDVRHRAPRQTRAGRDLPLQLYVPDGASRVVLHHRAPGEELFRDVPMTPNTPTLFFALIPGDAVTFRGLEYYFTISQGDRSAAFPSQGPARPIQVAVR